MRRHGTGREGTGHRVRGTIAVVAVTVALAGGCSSGGSGTTGVHPGPERPAASDGGYGSVGDPAPLGEWFRYDGIDVDLRIVSVEPTEGLPSGVNFLVGTLEDALVHLGIPREARAQAVVFEFRGDPEGRAASWLPNTRVQVRDHERGRLDESRLSQSCDKPPGLEFDRLLDGDVVATPDDGGPAVITQWRCVLTVPGDLLTVIHPHATSHAYWDPGA